MKHSVKVLRPAGQPQASIGDTGLYVASCGTCGWTSQPTGSFRARLRAKRHRRESA